MVFANLIFLYLFLPANLILYYLLKKDIWRNVALIAFSLFFYAWGEPVWVFVLIFSVGIDYWNGRVIEKCRGTRRAKMALILSVAVNLSLLGLFKYSGMLVSTLNALLPFDFPVPSFTLPIGISFYSFQAVSYVVDVYRGQVRAQEKYYKVLMYVSLYPQLVAGPIVRYSDIASEIDSRSASAQDIMAGLTRMICGLTKKVVIANTAGELLKPHLMGGVSSVAGAWYGILLFTLQIYYDFSGYSDMAIGLGRLFGFHYLENFNYPYISKSASEFWRRWHISLGGFFRDYVYIPLGGNRSHLYLNLLVVWFLTGLWHGAHWNFVLWGLFYGGLIALERVWLGDKLKRAPAFVPYLYAVGVTLIGWTIFYFTDTGALLAHLGVMFGLSGKPLWDMKLGIMILNNLYWLVVAVAFCLPIVPRVKQAFAARCNEKQMLLIRVGECVMDVLLLLVCTCLLVGESFNPFLYFRF